jgi:hypothetical protein
LARQIATNTRSNDAYSFTALANQNRTDTHNGLNQVTATGSTSVSHDARGNTSAIGSTAYTYTAVGVQRRWCGHLETFLGAGFGWVPIYPVCPE